MFAGVARATIDCLTTLWSGCVEHKVPSSYRGVRAAEINR
jgi:hypothetical protein